MRISNVILGGDLNFIVSRAKYRGDATRANHLAEFFINKLKEAIFVDIEPIKRVPTWRNMRVGQERVARRLDHLLIFSSLISDHNRITT